MWFVETFKNNPEFAMMQILIVVFSICCHEYMHARTALWQGDDTATQMGHLTLNPLKQMGVFSLILLFVIGIAFGQVPVNPSKLKGRYSEAMVSFAGPFTNLMLSVLFFIGMAVAITEVELADSNRFLVHILFTGAELNLVLFVLNMIPAPPLDGFGILRSFFPALKTTSSEFLNGAYFFIIIIVFVSAGHIFSFSRSVLVNALLYSNIDIEALKFYFT